MNVFKHIIELTFIFFQPWRFNWREWFMARLKSSFYVSWSKIQIQTASIALRKANVNPQWIYGMWFTNRTGKNGKTFWVIVFEFNDFSITFTCIDIITILIIFYVVIVVVRPSLDSTMFVRCTWMLLQFSPFLIRARLVKEEIFPVFIFFMRKILEWKNIVNAEYRTSRSKCFVWLMTFKLLFVPHLIVI